VPRIAAEKERGLRAWYGADDTTCGYFTLRQTADVHHAQLWRRLLEKADGGESCGCREKRWLRAKRRRQKLWGALDGMRSRRQAR